MYTQDGMALGHLRRSTNIAREVLRLAPEANILIIADSPGISSFPIPNGVDFLKLPAIHSNVAMGGTSLSDWRVTSLPTLSIESIIGLRTRIIQQAFSNFDPDVVLIDHQPVGALGELKPLFETKRLLSRRPAFFLGLRDILDEPHYVHKTWSSFGVYDFFSSFDAVLIYGSQDIYDLAAIYGLNDLGPEIIYCNYVVTPIEEVALPDGPPRILVMGGGRGDTLPLAKALLDCFPPLQAETNASVRILAGPNMALDDYEALVARSANYPVRVSRRFEDATHWLQRSDAVVTRAGYNSLCEILSLGKKAVVVPRAGPGSEQRMRSRFFAERGLIDELDTDSLTPERLGQALMRLLTKNDVPQLGNSPPLDGAEIAARVLLDAM
jgi:predicted glycosyltransferase